ncbi:MAG: DCC1-like thiol-disulfide oxidoreductase family protein [Proteobacteria bacterium]|nr:DCC1-like thiol-disulfide oxidoreductase family protein [Pseudomonadota bacterium]
MDNNGKVLFNEKCSICNFEIKHYKKRSHLTFDDCSHMEDKYLKKLHVVFDDEKELVGVDAFIYIWKRTKGYGWLGTFVGLPIVKQCAIFAYSILAFLLFWRFKIFNPPQLTIKLDANDYQNDLH